MGNLLMFHLQSARSYNVYLSIQTTSKHPKNRGGGVKLPSPPHFPPSLSKPLLYANTAKKQEITEVASIENLMIKAWIVQQSL